MTDKKSPKWVPQLLAWYDVNKRDLPWRDCGDPYKVWVSEVMSQQTRIEAMKPYYDNWMRLFPTLEDLAKASEDEVVHATANPAYSHHTTPITVVPTWGSFYQSYYLLTVYIQINACQVFTFKHGVHSGQIHLIYRTIISTKYNGPF